MPSSFPPPSPAGPCGFPHRRSGQAFSLLELLTVVFIVAILAVMALPLVAKARQRAQVAACAANLKSLYVGANGYVQEHNQWPQIRPPKAKEGHDDRFVTAWMDALGPYGITPTTWVCPELHRLRGRPDLSVPANRAVDYLAYSYDAKPRRPYEHSNMPWFMETTNAHGNGQLIIFSNGTVMGMREAIATFAENTGKKK